VIVLGKNIKFNIVLKHFIHIIYPHTCIYKCINIHRSIIEKGYMIK